MRIPKFEIVDTVDGEFGFHLRGANGEIQAPSEGYGSRSKARRAIDQLRRNAAKAEIVDVTKRKQPARKGA